MVIVGGAIIGSSIAYFLRELGFAGRVVVVERDPTYAQSSTALSVACIRTLCGCPVNIHMSLHGADFFRNIKQRFGPEADIGFVENGYLILSSSEVVSARQAGVDMQRTEGVDILQLTPERALRRFPWLNVADQDCHDPLTCSARTCRGSHSPSASRPLGRLARRSDAVVRCRTSGVWFAPGRGRIAGSKDQGHKTSETACDDGIYGDPQIRR